MEYPPAYKRKYYHIISTVFVSIILLTILFLALFAYIERTREDDTQEITNRFMAFENSFKGFINDNSILLSGIAAYIEAFDEYRDEEVYAYLDNLIKKNGEFINNVAIVQGTTIRWNYPLEGNEITIGIDMLTISGQADDIIKVKEKLEKVFSGPMELIQGGTGYIIRIPIIKDGSYWGVASMILRADKLNELFDKYANENNIEVNLYRKNSDEKLICGTECCEDKNAIKYEMDILGEEIIYCVVPLDNTIIYRMPYFIVIFISGLVIVSYTTYQAYLFFRRHEDIIHKNYILKSSVVRDKLTGIFNRAYLDVSIGEEMKFANDTQIPVSLIYMDIDNFKNINDTYGHAIGDIVLKEFAIAIKAVVRNRDVFARWGGDEFTILMPNTDIRGAEVAAVKIRAAIESIEYKDAGYLSASIGVAEYKLGESADDLFKRVDKALYEAKANKGISICICDYDGNIRCIVYNV
jgi:diguanylate cyclase (GGDEF)-like protein